MFFPTDTFECPVPILQLTDQRTTQGRYVSGCDFQRTENWRDNVEAHMIAPAPWTGKTIFNLTVPHQDTTQDCFHNQSDLPTNLYSQVTSGWWTLDGGDGRLGGVGLFSGLMAIVSVLVCVDTGLGFVVTWPSAAGVL